MHDDSLKRLNSSDIKKNLTNNILVKDAHIYVYNSLPSTNDFFKLLPYHELKGNSLCLAETQTEGRGRREKKWFSPHGKNVYLSYLWKNKKKLNDIQGMSLVVSLAIVETLKIFNIKDFIKIKWPNDIYWKDEKISGSLLEIITNNYLSNSYVIIGVGLNVNMDEVFYKNIDQPWTSMKNILKINHDRNIIVGALVNQIYMHLEKLNAFGLNFFLKKWAYYDYLLGKEVVLSIMKKKIIGTALGLNKQGLLLIETPKKKIISCSSGEISVRLKTT